MKTTHFILGAGLVGVCSLMGSTAHAQETVNSKKERFYKAYVTVKAYHQEYNGSAKRPDSQVRVQIHFPDQKKIELPSSDQFWSVSNKQTQDINETFEVPQEFLVADGFSFEVSIIEKGKDIQPCKVKVNQLSQFNRTYFCRTDVNAQVNQLHLKEDKVAKQAVELRVFSDINSTSKEIPRKLVALKKP